LISAPLRGAIGRMVLNGLDVHNKNIKNPTKTNEITPMLFDFKISSL
jgi:hypothetical protein